MHKDLLTWTMKKGFLLTASCDKKKARKQSTIRTTHSNSNPPSSITSSINNSEDDHKHIGREDLDLDEEQLVHHEGKKPLKNATTITTLGKKKLTRCSSLLLLEEDSIDMTNRGPKTSSHNRSATNQEDDKESPHSVPLSLLNLIVPPNESRNRYDNDAASNDTNSRIILPLSTFSNEQGNANDKEEDNNNTMWIKECFTTKKWKRQSVMMDEEEGNYDVVIQGEIEHHPDGKSATSYERNNSSTIITESSSLHGRNTLEKTASMESKQHDHRSKTNGNYNNEFVALEYLPSDLSKLIAKLKQRHAPQTKKHVTQVSKHVALQEFFVRYKIMAKGQRGNIGKGGGLVVPALKVEDEDEEKTKRQAIRFVWDTILEGLSKFTKDMKKICCQPCDLSCDQSNAIHKCLPPVFLIGYGLLETCPKVSCDEMVGICFDSFTSKRNHNEYDDDDDDMRVFEDSSLKRRKVQRLGAMLIVRYYILEMYRRCLMWIQRGDDKGCLEEDGAKVVGSIQVVLQLLEYASVIFQSTLEDKDGNIRRSVLAVNSMDTYFWILQYSSLIYQLSLYKQSFHDLVGKVVEPLPNYLWKNVSILEKLLETLKRWNEATYSDGHKGKTIITTTVVSSASCVEGLLKDWAFSLRHVRDSYDKRTLLDDMVNEQDARLESVEILARELAGIYLQSNGKVLHCYGGIAQTLCKQSTTSDGDIFNGLQVALDAAKSCIFQEQEEFFCAQKVGLGENATFVMKHVCGLLSRKKDVVGRMDGESRTRAVESCLTLLRSKSERCIELVQTVLNMFWSTEDGLPHDLRQLDDIDVDTPIPEDKIPQSFQILSEYIRSYSEDGDSDSSCQKVLSSLLERFLLRKPTLLIPYFLSKAKYNESECNVLVNLLVNRKKHKQVSAELCVIIEQELFKRIDHDKHLQRVIHSKSRIFQSLPLKTLIDRLWDILRLRDPSDLASSAASALMMDFLEQHVLEQGDDIVSHLLACLSRSYPRTANGNTEPQRFTKSTKFIEKWSKSLVTSDKCGDNSFASLVAACGREMFQDPSNSLILTLFGTVMDGSTHATGCDNQNRDKACKRVAIAVIKIVHLCTLKIEQYDELNAKSDESIVFHRLSPLLLLRRMSHIQFGIARNYSEEGRKELMRLARNIAKNLGISTEQSNSQNLSKEERKLFADIAAVCLPFSNTENQQERDNFISGFLFFCEDTLLATLNSLKNHTLSSVDFKSVKVSLYIACRVVQIAPDTIGRTELHFLLKFVLSFLNINSNILSDDVDEPILELQTCCIEFLSTCICAIYAFPKDHHRYERQLNLIEEISKDEDTTDQKRFQSSASTILQNLRMFQNDLLTLIHGNGNLRQVDLAMLPLSVSARICLLNAVTISCRMCSSESLPELSKTIAPSILLWLTSGEIGDDIRHPLCVASAMQSILHCLQRSKSFDCLEACKTKRKDAVRNLFRLQLHCVQSRLNHVNTSEENTMRLSSLKLLVLMITLNQGLESSNDNQSYAFGFLLPSDITQCFSVLNGLANIDENEEVRALASHLVAIVYAR